MNYEPISDEGFGGGVSSMAMKDGRRLCLNGNIMSSSSSSSMVLCFFTSTLTVQHHTPCSHHDAAQTPIKRLTTVISGHINRRYSGVAVSKVLD